MVVENKRKKKAKARALIINGATLEEASKLSDLSIDVVKKMSAKEGLRKNQLSYLKTFQEELQDRILINKLKRLELNNLALQSIEDEIKSGKTDKNTLEKIRLNEEVEQKILEKDRLITLQKIELDMSKILVNAKIRTHELLNKDINIDKKDIDEFEKELDIWALEVWGEGAEDND